MALARPLEWAVQRPTQRLGATFYQSCCRAAPLLCGLQTSQILPHTSCMLHEGRLQSCSFMVAKAWQQCGDAQGAARSNSMPCAGSPDLRRVQPWSVQAGAIKRVVPPSGWNASSNTPDRRLLACPALQVAVSLHMPARGLPQRSR